MNRKLVSIFLFIIMSIISSCNTAPANRPTLNRSSNVVEEPVEDKTEEELLQEQLEQFRRPDNAVRIKSDFCACQEGRAISWGSNCDAFCSDKTSPSERLYLNIEETQELIERADIQTFFNWCNTPIIVDAGTENEVNLGEAKCEIELKTSTGAISNLEIEAESMTPGTTSITSIVSGINFNETYRLRIVEINSGVSSDTVQLRKTTTPITDPIGGPLWTLPVSRYTCINTITSQDPNNPSVLFFDDASRLHFYFNSETRPDPLPSNFGNVYCHDIVTFGTTPRNQPLLEETPGALTLWNTLDPRFFDTDGDGSPQIDQLLLQAIIDQGFFLAEAPQLFFKFNWATGFDTDDASNNNTDGGVVTVTPENADLGYYMTPWIDQTTFRSYCPTQSHYYSSNQIFVAMRDLIGVDTEGLYIAEKESSNTLILVRESDIKPIWFYNENGQNIEPNDNTITGKKVQFFWPADPTSPYIKKSHQTTYTVKRASEIGSAVSQDSQNNTGTPTQYPTHDKRIGCIPRL